MKTISIDDIRESLAMEDAGSIDAPDLFDVMLKGYVGYNQHKDEDCLDWYLERDSLLDCDLEDEDPVKVAIVLGSDGKPKFEVFQHYQEFCFKEINS